MFGSQLSVLVNQPFLVVDSHPGSSLQPEMISPQPAEKQTSLTGDRTRGKKAPFPEFSANTFLQLFDLN